VRCRSVGAYVGAYEATCSVGAIVDRPELRNFFGAENGFGALPIEDTWQIGTQMTQPGLNDFQMHSSLVKVADSVFVGVLLDAQRDGLLDCAARTGVSYAFEDWQVAFRDWAYSGLQRGGYGGSAGNRIAYGESAVSAWLEIQRTAFVAFASPLDACANRTGVAIANEAAAAGQGLCANQIFNPTSIFAYSNVLTQAHPLCFENSMRAIDPSKNQPNRLRFDRAREFQSLVGTSRLTG
jgi:hypothetical protein